MDGTGMLDNYPRWVAWLVVTAALVVVASAIAVLLAAVKYLLSRN